jgi:hypothetical protein
MRKMVILGAGASKACPNTDPNLPMPLLNDLPAVLRRASPASGYHMLGQYLDRLLSAADGDIEILLTQLLRLDRSFFVPRKQYLLDAEFIREILASGALPEVFHDIRDQKQAAAILGLLGEIAGESPGAAITTFSPRNFFTMFQGALREYFQASFQRYPCPLHLLLFKGLERFDCVVSFNYDEIADYTLWSAGRLTRLSFEGLGFEEVILPTRPTDSPSLQMLPLALRQLVLDQTDCVKFLKIHGSFNWYCQIEETGVPAEDFRYKWTYPVGPPPMLRQSSKGGPQVRYCLGKPSDSVNRQGWTVSPVIFPFLSKESVYLENAMFARHLAAFQQELRSAGSITLVGKNFSNADYELNGLIRYATYGSADRVLDIVDPNPSIEFESFHCSLFNARLGHSYRSLADYPEAPTPR